MPEPRILMGVIGRPHGVRGLVRVHSYTATPDELPQYGPFADDRGRRFTLRWRGEGIAEITEIVDGKPVPVRDRDAAGRLVNVRLYVERDRLPPPEEDEFYLADLIGLQAVGPDGRVLGRVDTVHDYGAGASLEIGPLLVPFTRAAVPEVDLAAGRVTIVLPDEVVVAEQAAAPDRESAA
ncbi:Ribosome maturation factor RimM [Rhodovastum atsumiense]|uniref:Ribosome maturation factor RimM n=1 Tax=Rhodovastum atsumiense TaxID=504468 RepID=A0A5M6IL43_9PROT|nr:ribosome maturation factor RimM [Rhodovastum atsumiense]KAA5608954.1 16S rRNA processing protein RimM [Rhodovastum atsumiense]CAH2603702.1 Ribosome maturation factor RimM [Rhodovastum atsumiense]